MGYGFLQKPEFISVAAREGLTVSIEARSSFFTLVSHDSSNADISALIKL